MLKRMTLAITIAAASAVLSAAPALAGKWDLVAKGTPHGDMQMQVTLKQAEGSKTISAEMTMMNQKVQLTGEAADGSFTMKGKHHDMELTLTGKLKGDGTLEGFLSTEQGDLTWTGTRAK